jgi:hypothetical protein
VFLINIDIHIQWSSEVGGGFANISSFLVTKMWKEEKTASAEISA